MSEGSKIEWTNATWNPVVGCRKVSAGCRNCYAVRDAVRLARHPHAAGTYDGLTSRRGGAPANWTGDVRCLPERLTDPLRWSKGRLVFVNSMSDLFHEDVPEVFIRQVFGVMVLARWHSFQMLTKRASRLAELAPRLVWPDNVWAGVSVENEAAAWRVDALRRVPAAVRWVSAEPLLGPVQLNLSDIDWVVTGGESGPGFRPFEMDWAIGVRDQCEAAGVRYYHKQNGGKTPKAGGRDLDGRTYDDMPPRSTRPVARRAERVRWIAAIEAASATGGGAVSGRFPLPVT